MKKLFAVMLMLFAMTWGCAFAKEYDFPGTLHIGLGAEYQPVFGPLSEYVNASAGAGVSVEFDLPTNSFYRMGISAHGSFNANTGISQQFESISNARVSLGFYGRIPLGGLRFYFVPEASAGIIAYMPKVKPEYQGQLQKMYLDTCLQAGLGFRIVPGLMNNRLEFEITPLYTLAMEQGNLAHYAGGRIGALIKL